MAILFVYGTLMRGQRNNHLLAGQTYLGVGQLDGYGLYQVNERFPGIVKQERGKVIGQIYEVDASTIRKLDMHEGTNLGIYSRELVEIYINDKLEIAHTYVWLKDIDREDEIDIQKQPWDSKWIDTTME